MDSKISKTTQSLTTAEEMRNQTKLIMQPYANWEEYLSPAPLSIAILGELVFISSATDFSINKNSPEIGYKFIKYPESFRACLMQVCNSGWWAFNEAHKSMDQIRLHTSQVPDYMKTTVKILFQDDEVVEALLPDQLKNIQVIADECVELSENAEKGFTSVINIIQELLEACINAEHFYGDQMEKTKKKIEETKLREHSAQEAKKRTEKAAKVLEEELENANKNYQKALDSLPNGWDLLGMSVVEGLTKTVTSVVSGLTLGNMNQNRFQKSTSAPQTGDCFEPQADFIDEIRALSKSDEMLSVAQNISSLCVSKDGEINWKNIYDQKEKKTKTDEHKSQFDRIKSDLARTPDSPAKTQSLEICNMGINLCKQLAIFAPNGKCDQDNSTNIKKMILKLEESALTFDSNSKDMSNVSSLNQKPPMISKQQNSSGDMTAAELAVQNAQTAIQQTQSQLNNATMRYDKCIENFEKNQKELIDILVTMRNCELKKIDFETTIQMLVKGMDAMGRVKEQWEKMIHFFQMVSNIVKISLSKTLTNFVSTAEKTQTLSYNAKLFSKDLLYNQAFFASNVASLVHMIAGTYTEISSKYLMDRVSSLGKLMAMDKSKPDFETEIQKLRDGCDEAERKILDLVLRNKDEFEKNSARRLERIDQELLAILPPAPPEKIKRIQDAVQTGFSEDAYI